MQEQLQNSVKKPSCTVRPVYKKLNAYNKASTIQRNLIFKLSGTATLIFSGCPNQSITPVVTHNLELFVHLQAA